jgi:Flp pilus assembly protein TadB
LTLKLTSRLTSVRGSARPPTLRYYESIGKADARAGAGIVGLGAVACAACCAGPVVAFLAAVGVTVVLGAVLSGAVGLAAALVAAVVLWRRRARRCAPAPSPDEPVTIGPPRLRPRS